MKSFRAMQVYLLLLAAWGTICVWQLYEHVRVKESARLGLVNRARDISYSLSAVIQSQGAVVRSDQLQAALKGLAKSSELRSVALLNATGQVVASAGQALKLDVDNLPKSGERWDKDAVTFVNLIDLGAESEGGTTRPATIILPLDNDDRTSPGVRHGPPRPVRQSIKRTSESVVVSLEFPPDTPTSGSGGLIRPDRNEPRRGPLRPLRQTMDRTSGALVMRLEYPPDTPPNELAFFERGPDDRGPGERGPGDRGPGERGRDDGGRGDRGRFRRGPGPPWPPRFGRPFWMEPARYDELLQRQGLHGFVLLMSTVAFRAETTRDFWLRLVVMSVTLATVGAFGLAWRNIGRTAQLQLRLIRASEMNSYLRELNIAAAGLAHETRNPLNIIGGLAQMIARQEDVSPNHRKKLVEIAQEVERVTHRLNEFIEYSRPREAKPTPTQLNTVVHDVERALESDIQDKAIRFSLEGPNLTVEADESMLRQLLFNLLLNSAQAAAPGGQIEVKLGNDSAGQAHFEVCDNGPGIPEASRQNIFQPYFTTHEGGTGLGLAVVRQIALAHGWDIEYLPNDNGGARFRVSGLRVSARVP